MRDLIDELLHAKVKSQLFGGDHAPKLGRLVLQERIGAGAMGTVFAALDPRLERTVAVKVLRGEVDSARVLAEARALAKLAHPNVVAIHDADEVDGLVYIVMEHVPGVPLRSWIGEGRHWQEIVRVMREAGSGIAAAHAAGLVHRDIKPDNILIGTDRARVVDFGLAHTQLDTDGTSAGTPFYMAPEVLAGGAATAASDQFSFAVTLYEALYGKRPHGDLPTSQAATERATARGGTLVRLSQHDLIEELRAAATSAAKTPRPAGNDVPAWVHAAIVRGLDADPAARFPSMTDFVVALQPKRPGSRIGVIAGVALVIGVSIGALAYRRHARANACNGGPDRLATAWSDDTRSRIASAFGNTPWATQTLAALDGKAAEWQRSYTHVCEATRVRGDQSDTLLDLRMRCLDRALRRFGALAGELSASTDMPARVAAPGAVSEIDVATCETLTDPGELALPADPAQRAKAEEIEHGLDRTLALFSLGHYKQARDALPELQGVSLPRLTAARLALAASIEARIGNPDAARTLLDQALLAAAEAKAPGVELEVWSRRLRNELFAGDPAKVLEWANFARAAAKHAGRDGAEIDGIVGEALRADGQLGPARDLLTAALASHDPLRPEQRAVLEMNLGSVQLAAGTSTAAMTTLTQARDRVLSTFGDQHPDLALYNDKLAAAERARGMLRKAMELHDRSLALRTAAFGADDRAVATSLLYRAQTELEAGDVLAADADAARAKAIREKVYGPKSPRLGEVLVTIGDINVERGIREIAVQQYAQAAALDQRLDLIGRRAAAGETIDIATVAALADEPLPSVDHLAALAVRVDVMVKRGDPIAAKQLASRLRQHLTPDSDPAAVLAVGQALLAVDDRAAATDVLGAAAKRLGNEPTRTALHLVVALAKASGDSQAARTAISLYQALPKLDRTDYDALWEQTKR